MPKQTRGKDGRYASQWRSVRLLIGVVVIASVLLSHLHNSNDELEQRLDNAQRTYIELLNKQDALIQEAVKLQQPDKERWKIKHQVTVSAYNTVPEQTDSTPCIAADGSDVCKLASAGHCIVAHNTLPLGTRITLEGFGDCTVRDRINARYDSHYLDVLMGTDVVKAKTFGRKSLLYTIKDN